MIYESVNYFNSKHDRIEYAELLNECVNVELRGKFGLSGFSAIEYCVNDIDRPPPGKIIFLCNQVEYFSILNFRFFR